MPKLGINVSSATTAFEVLPDGNYDLKIADVQLTKTKESNKPMLKITFEVVGGEYAGKKIFENAVLDSRRGQFLVNQIETAIGGDPTDPDTDNWTTYDGTIEGEVTTSPAREGYDPSNRVRLLVELEEGEEVLEEV